MVLFRSWRADDELHLLAAVEVFHGIGDRGSGREKRNKVAKQTRSPSTAIAVKRQQLSPIGSVDADGGSVRDGTVT